MHASVCVCMIVLSLLWCDFVRTGSLDELVRHALQALRECLPSEAELTAKVAISFDFPLI